MIAFMMNSRAAQKRSWPKMILGGAWRTLWLAAASLTLADCSYSSAGAGASSICEECRVVLSAACPIGAIQDIGDDLVAVACLLPQGGDIRVYSLRDRTAVLRADVHPMIDMTYYFATLADGAFAVAGISQGRGGAFVLRNSEAGAEGRFYFADEYQEFRLQRVSLVHGSSCIAFTEAAGRIWSLTLLDSDGRVMDRSRLDDDPYVQTACAGAPGVARLLLLPQTDEENQEIERLAQSSGVPSDYFCYAVDQSLQAGRRHVIAQCSGRAPHGIRSDYQVYLSSTLDDPLDYDVDLVLQDGSCLLNPHWIASGALLYGRREGACAIYLARGDAEPLRVAIVSGRDSNGRSGASAVATVAPCVENGARSCLLFAFVQTDDGNVYETDLGVGEGE